MKKKSIIPLMTRSPFFKTIAIIVDANMNEMGININEKAIYNEKCLVKIAFF